MSIKEKGSRKQHTIWMRIEGIVRHYHTADSDQHPYRGLLKTENDEHSEFGQLYEMLKDFPDGEHVTIMITSHGKHPNAEGHIWFLTKPNTYERIDEGGALKK